MTTREIIDTLDAEHEGILIADGFDDAIIGICERAGRPPVVCYDYNACVDILMSRSEMSQAEAEEYLDFNTCGAWMGARTPVFLHDWRKTA